MRSGERDEDGSPPPLLHPAGSLLILVVEGQEFAVGPFIRGNLSRRWASGINSAP